MFVRILVKDNGATPVTLNTLDQTLMLPINMPVDPCCWYNLLTNRKAYYELCDNLTCSDESGFCVVDGSGDGYSDETMTMLIVTIMVMMVTMMI